jgi:hypothetical protein
MAGQKEGDEDGRDEEGTVEKSRNKWWEEIVTRTGKARSSTR